MFDHKIIEKKWANHWDENKVFYTDVWDFSKPKFYALDMFPYPSGHGLHVGHPEGYTATDIISRMKRMQGYNVLHPMGFDSFGLPAEQYAIQTGNHPGKFTEENIITFTRQLKMCGFSFDWSKQVSTCDPSYYRWTQWIFEKLYENGLAKNIDMPVNWCEELGTVLANDEIIDGKSERGGFDVVKRNMRQWVLTIPKYADRLLKNLENLDWPNSTKEMQKNWIGKSIGAEVDFKVANSAEKFTVFTTRCDTLFGATYCVLSPEHELVNLITSPDKMIEVKKYQERCSKMSELERTELNKEKTGVFIGAYAINPINETNIPIFISDYVLASYGTGAIMAVPAHDQRDYDFAKMFNLDIIQVLDGGDISVQAYEGDGTHINSGMLNGMNKQEAIDTTIKWLEEHGVGKMSINYKLRDWIFARQRYWGEPVPAVIMEDGKIKLVPENELPLVLPEMEDYKSKNGLAPLENATQWKNVVIDGMRGKRETATMPGSAGSSWYFLRYIDPNNTNEIADKKLLEHWLPVDLYMGGPEHAVGHLLYSRFWNEFLYDIGVVPVEEPFKKLRHQGMILGENNEKMSKSRGNVVNPDEIIEKFGADTLRLYEMFMGPIEDAKPWNTKNLEGSRKFLDRVYRLFAEENRLKDVDNAAIEKAYHKTVKKVTEDYENMCFNTAISQLMIFINTAYKENVLPIKYARGFIQLLNPICPFITEELWHEFLGEKEELSLSKWPRFDESKTLDEEVEIIIQINGKIKEKIMIPLDTSETEMEKIALSSQVIKEALGGDIPKKVIPIKNRLVNIVK